MSEENAYKVLIRKCPNCGAQIPFDAREHYICTYCNTHLTLVTPKAQAQQQSQTQTAAEQPSSRPEQAQRPDINFERQTDSTEGAFSVLVPENWQTTGGVERTKSGSWLGVLAQNKPAKIDFTVMKDAQATIAIRWLPDMTYIDMQSSATGKLIGQMYPPGSKYSGFTVMPVQPATQFLTQTVFPSVHSQAQQVNFVEQQTLPMIAQGYQQRMCAINPGSTTTYDAGMILATYQEKNISFKETLFCLVENTGLRGDGKWGSKETLLIRAPENVYHEWLLTFSKIQQSVELNPQWILNETKSRYNIGVALMNEAQVQVIVQAILQNHQAAKTAINQALFQ